MADEDLSKYHVKKPQLQELPNEQTRQLPTLGQGTPSISDVQRRRNTTRRFRELPWQVQNIGAPIQTAVRNIPVVGRQLSDTMSAAAGMTPGDEMAIEGYRQENPIASFGARAAGGSLPYIAGGPASIPGRIAYGALVEGSDALSEGQDPIVGAGIGALGGAAASLPGRATTPRTPQAVAGEAARIEARRNEMTDQAMGVITGRRRDVPGILTGYEPFLRHTQRTYKRDLDDRIKAAGDRLVREAHNDPRYMFELREYLGRVNPSQPNYGQALDEARIHFENTRIRSRVNRQQITDEFNERLREGIHAAMPNRMQRELRERRFSPENITAWLRTAGGYGAATMLGAHPAAGAAIGFLSGPATRTGRRLADKIINSRRYNKWLNNQVLSPRMQNMLYGSLMGTGHAAGATPEELAPGLIPTEAILSQLGGQQ